MADGFALFLSAIDDDVLCLPDPESETEPSDAETIYSTSDSDILLSEADSNFGSTAEDTSGVDEDNPETLDLTGVSSSEEEAWESILEKPRCSPVLSQVQHLPVLSSREKVERWNAVPDNNQMSDGETVTEFDSSAMWKPEAKHIKMEVTSASSVCSSSSADSVVLVLDDLISDLTATAKKDSKPGRPLSDSHNFNYGTHNTMHELSNQVEIAPHESSQKDLRYQPRRVRTTVLTPYPDDKQCTTPPKSKRLQAEVAPPGGDKGGGAGRMVKLPRDPEEQAARPLVLSAGRELNVDVNHNMVAVRDSYGVGNRARDSCRHRSSQAWSCQGNTEMDTCCDSLECTLGEDTINTSLEDIFMFPECVPKLEVEPARRLPPLHGSREHFPKLLVSPPQPLLEKPVSLVPKVQMDEAACQIAPQVHKEWLQPCTSLNLRMIRETFLAMKRQRPAVGGSVPARLFPLAEHLSHVPEPRTPVSCSGRVPSFVDSHHQVAVAVAETRRCHIVKHSLPRSRRPVHCDEAQQQRNRSPAQQRPSSQSTTPTAASWTGPVSKGHSLTSHVSCSPSELVAQVKLQSPVQLVGSCSRGNRLKSVKATQPCTPLPTSKRCLFEPECRTKALAIQGHPVPPQAAFPVPSPVLLRDSSGRRVKWQCTQ